MRKHIILFLKTAVLLAAIAALAFSSGGVTEAARDALTTCLTVLLPALFPFFVLTRLLVGSGGARLLGKVCNCVMRPLFGIRGEGAAAFVIGLLSGYPVGAKTATDLYRQGLVSRDEAQSLLGFCNNSGPLFIIGAVGAGMLGNRHLGFYLLAVHAAAAITVGVLSRVFIRSRTLPAPAHRATAAHADLFTQAVEGGVQTILTVFGYVIFFAVVMALLTQYRVPALVVAMLSPLNLPAELIDALLRGFLELTGGIKTTAESAYASLPLQLTFISFFLGWAGWSVHLQVRGFITQSGLSFRRYLAAKLAHGGIAAVYAAFTAHLVAPPAAPATAIHAHPASSYPSLMSALSLISLAILLMYLIRSHGSATKLRRSARLQTPPTP